MPLKPYHQFTRAQLRVSLNQLQVAVGRGIASVVQDPNFFSSVPQALSSFECGIFLSRWLFSVASEDSQSCVVSGELSDLLGSTDMC